MGLIFLPTFFPDILTSMRLFTLQFCKAVSALSIQSSKWGFIKGTQVPGLCAGSSQNTSETPVNSALKEGMSRIGVFSRI